MRSSIYFCHSGPFPLFSFCYSDPFDSLGQEFGIWEEWYTKGLGNRFLIQKGEKGILYLLSFVILGAYFPNFPHGLRNLWGLVLVVQRAGCQSST